MGAAGEAGGQLPQGHEEEVWERLAKGGIPGVTGWLAWVWGAAEGAGPLRASQRRKARSPGTAL